MGSDPSEAANSTSRIALVESLSVVPVVSINSAEPFVTVKVAPEMRLPSIVSTHTAGRFPNSPGARPLARKADLSSTGTMNRTCAEVNVFVGPPVISGLTNPHRVELAFEIAAPEFEKAAQLREVRSNVQLLPDEALQQVRMIRQTVDDLRGGQTIIAGFLLLVVAHLRVLSCDVPSWPKSMRD